VEPDLLSRLHALHHAAQLPGVVLPNTNNEGRVLARVLRRLHVPAPFAIVHASFLTTVVRAEHPRIVPGSVKNGVSGPGG